MMQYKDISGRSGIIAYFTGHDYIEVLFRDNVYVYRYSYKRPGKIHVEKLKFLALKGTGLGTYISQHIRSEYECKRPVAAQEKELVAGAG